jgi:hypothetical protein
MSEVKIRGGLGPLFVLTKNDERRYLTTASWLRLMNVLSLDELWAIATTGPVAEAIAKDWSK